MTYSLKSCNVIIEQSEKAVLIVFDKGDVNSLTHCSKVFSKIEKADKAIKKIIDLKLTLEELTSVDKLEKKPTYKFHLNQKRYQDKRKIEKMFSIYKAETYKGSQPHILTSIKKKRPLELLVPVELKVQEKNCLFWVRESKILSDEWIEKLGYQKAFFLLLKIKETLKRNPNQLLATPNRGYVLAQIN